MWYIFIWYVWYMVHMLPLRLVGLNLVLSPWVYWKTFKTIPMNKFYRISVCEQLQRFDMFPVGWYDNAFSASVTPIIFKVVAVHKLGSQIHLAKNNCPIVWANITENLSLFVFVQSNAPRLVSSFLAAMLMICCEGGLLWNWTFES